VMRQIQKRPSKEGSMTMMMISRLCCWLLETRSVQRQRWDLLTPGHTCTAPGIEICWNSLEVSIPVQVRIVSIVTVFAHSWKEFSWDKASIMCPRAQRIPLPLMGE